MPIYIIKLNISRHLHSVIYCFSILIYFKQYILISINFPLSIARTIKVKKKRFRTRLKYQMNRYLGV